MRILLGIVFVLTTSTALWCAAGYFSTKPQQFKTRAELLRTRANGQPISDKDIEVHVSRIGHQGTNLGIAAVMAGAAALGAIACLIADTKKTQT